MQILSALILFSLVFLTIGGLFFLAKKYISCKKWTRLLGELFIPAVLVFIYGIGSLVVLVEDSSDRWIYYGVIFSNFDLLFGYIVILAAIVCYIWAYKRTFLSNKILFNKSQVSEVYVESGIKIGILIILVIDLLVRIYEIKNGIYFNWMSSVTLAQGDIEQGVLNYLRKSWAPLIAVFLCWRSVGSRFWFLIFTFFCLLIFMEGDRSTLVILTCGVFLSYVFLNENKINFFKLQKQVLLIIGVLIFLFQVIVSIRVDFRNDLSYLLDHPSALPVKILTEYLPNALSFDRVTGEDQNIIESDQGFGYRLRTWPAYLASINARIFNGWSHVPVSHFFRALSLPIPSIIFPGEKPVIETGAIIENHFSLGKLRFSTRNLDPACTVFADIYTYFNIFGVVFLAIIMGIFNASIAKYLIYKWRRVGVLVFFGLIGTFQVTYNSFANALVNFRSQVLLIFILSCFVFSARVFYDRQKNVIGMRRG